MAGQRLLQLPFDQRPIVSQIIDKYQKTIVGSAFATADATLIAYVQFLIASHKQDRFDLRVACHVYSVALAIYERLAAAQPKAYESYVATTLNNLGTVLSDLRALNEARQAYTRAMEIQSKSAERGQ